MHKLSEKYKMVTDLLITFLEDTYYDDREDIDTIKRFVKEYNEHQIQKVLTEGKDVLRLRPFPAKWILDTIYGSSEGELNPDKTKKWLKEILKILETEADKSGKLSNSRKYRTFSARV
jgi:hypothetical protein